MSDFNRTCSVLFRHLLPPDCGSGSGGSGDCGTYQNEIVGFRWNGSEGITVEKDIPSGIITVTIPEGGCLANWSLYVRNADANYNAGNISGGVAVRIDNSANDVNLLYNTSFFSITSGLTIDQSNPLQLNAAVTLDPEVHEFSGGITLMCFDDISGRATNGGFLVA